MVWMLRRLLMTRGEGDPLLAQQPDGPAPMFLRMPVRPSLFLVDFIRQPGDLIMGCRVGIHGVRDRLIMMPPFEKCKRS